MDFIHLLAADHDFAGDRPLAHTRDCVLWLRQTIPPAVRIELDGGLDTANVGPQVEAGVDDVVVGRAICGKPNWAQAVREVRAFVPRSLKAG